MTTPRWEPLALLEKLPAPWVPGLRDRLFAYVLDAVTFCMSKKARQVVRDGVADAIVKATAA